MAQQAILRRLQSLRNWEAFNVFFLPLLFVWMAYRANLPTWFLYIYGMLLVSYILAQGSFYWHLKLRTLRQKQRALSTYFRPIFRFFKWSNIILILLFPGGVLLALATGQTGGFEIIWSTILVLFALLEYINYYHYQLKHDTWNDWSYLLYHRKLRVSPLAHDLVQANRFQSKH